MAGVGPANLLHEELSKDDALELCEILQNSYLSEQPWVTNTLSS